LWKFQGQLSQFNGLLWQFIEGEPKIWGASLAQARTHFSSGCDFMVGLGKPKLCSKFESLAAAVAEILKGDPNILGSSPSAGSRPFFVLVGFDDGISKTPTKYKRHQVYSPVVMLLIVSFGYSLVMNN